jgi:glycine cleavage system H protein
MDAFTYNNIFETKGIEYLIIIGFFIVLIPFWLILTKKITIPEKIRRIPGILAAGILNIPQGLFFFRNHTWAHLSRNGIAEIGLDDLLLHITGDVNFVSLRKKGEIVSKGDLIAEIGQNGKTLKILSPVSGEITATNNALSGDPGLMSDDPYGKGWIYKIKPTGWTTETSASYLAGDAVNWIGNELTRFRDFLMESASKYSHGSSELILQDGGELRDHTLSELPGEVWNSFQEDFMKLDEKGHGKGLSA